MQVGMIGLGRMGANMVPRLIKGGHECVVFNRSANAVFSPPIIMQYPRSSPHNGYGRRRRMCEFNSRMAEVWRRGEAHYENKPLSAMRFEFGEEEGGVKRKVGSSRKERKEFGPGMQRESV